MTYALDIYKSRITYFRYRKSFKLTKKGNLQPITKKRRKLCAAFLNFVYCALKNAFLNTESFKRNHNCLHYGIKKTVLTANLFLQQICFALSKEIENTLVFESMNMKTFDVHWF